MFNRTASIPSVAPHEASSLQQEGAVLVDVRETGEFTHGHAPGSRHYPLGQLRGSMQQLPKDQKLVAVCRTGSRSAQATKALRSSGYDVVNLDGGVTAWQRAGLPLQTADGGPGRVA